MVLAVCSRPRLAGLPESVDRALMASVQYRKGRWIRANNDLLKVYTTRTAPEAEMVRNLLESEGIPAQAAGEMQGGFAGVLEIPVFVQAADADRALTLLEAHGHAKPALGPQ